MTEFVSVDGPTILFPVPRGEVRRLSAGPGGKIWVDGIPLESPTVITRPAEVAGWGYFVSEEIPEDKARDFIVAPEAEAQLGRDREVARFELGRLRKRIEELEGILT